MPAAIPLHWLGFI
ncbi:hypothetical protein J4537_09280, partial [Klebsiella pneumoniae]|nr:hypothetical protein [Klebsiella pneumoniae]